MGNLNYDYVPSNPLRIGTMTCLEFAFKLGLSSSMCQVTSATRLDEGSIHAYVKEITNLITVMKVVMAHM